MLKKWENHLSTAKTPKNKQKGRNCCYNDLYFKLNPCRNPPMLPNFMPIVPKTYDAIPQRAKNKDPDFDIGQIAPQKDINKHYRQNKHSPHGWHTIFLFVRLWREFSG